MSMVWHFVKDHKPRVLCLKSYRKCCSFFFLKQRICEQWTVSLKLFLNHHWMVVTVSSNSAQSLSTPEKISKNNIFDIVKLRNVPLNELLFDI